MAGLGVVCSGFLYFQAATRLEERAVGAQQPAVAVEPAAARHVDRDRLMRDVARLASPDFEGRRTGTPGGLAARRWIVDQFAAIGLSPAGDAGGYLDPFSFTHRSIKGLLLPGRPFRTEYPNAANILGRVEGDVAGLKPIVVSAHYDHLGRQHGDVYAGADDNASGVAVLLAAARYFTANTPEHPLIFAAFDAEEEGLRGAGVFVETRPEARTAVLDVNLDMVSRNDRNEMFVAGTYHHPGLRPLIDDVQTRSAVKLLFGHDRPLYRSGWFEDWTGASDHGAFHDAGVPFIYFGVADHPDYHQPTDTPDKIDLRFFGAAADAIVEAIRTFDAKLR